MTLAELHTQAIYVAPSGRWCIWEPGVQGRSATTFAFRYMRTDGGLEEGFSLTEGNLKLLKPWGNGEARHAPRW